MNVVAIRSDSTARIDPECRPSDIVEEGPSTLEINGELLPHWFRTRDGRYWEADRVCSLREAAASDGRVVAPGILYRHITTKRLVFRWLVLATSLAVLTAAGVLVLGARI
jgi:hypothetical protein